MVKAIAWRGRRKTATDIRNCWPENIKNGTARVKRASSV
jgi:hypothetical protein